MWGMDYSRQHRSRPGSPVRKMCCLRRIRAFSTAEPLPHQTWLGVPTHRGVSRTMPGFESRPRQGHWNIVADDSLRSELPNLAGGLAVGIAGCRQCAETYPFRCDDFRDVGLCPRHVSGATVACVVRGQSPTRPSKRPRQAPCTCILVEGPSSEQGRAEGERSQWKQRPSYQDLAVQRFSIGYWTLIEHERFVDPSKNSGVWSSSWAARFLVHRIWSASIAGTRSFGFLVK